MSCPNEAVAARATGNPAASPERDGMTERPLQAGAVVILLLLPFGHPFDLFVQDILCLAPCYPLLNPRVLSLLSWRSDRNDVTGK